MSLYEPSVRSSSFSVASRRFTRPFTTLEGWREIGNGVFAIGSRVKMLTAKDDLDPEHYNNRQSSRRHSGDSTIPSVPAIPKAHLARAPGSAVAIAIASPKIASGTRPYAPHREVWDDVYPESVKEPEYHIFTRRKKWLITVLVGLTGTLPGLTFNMFLPAAKTIAKDLRVGPITIDATIALYLALQGFAGLVLVPLSNSIGRRPVLIFSLLLYVIASVFLTMPSTIQSVFALRGLQAIGMAPIPQISRAVLEDITLPDERQVFSSFFLRYQSMLFVFAPAMGGLFLSTLPFRVIFVFLLSVSAAAFLVTALFLPETARTIVGNGSISATGIHKPLVACFHLRKGGTADRSGSRPRRTPKVIEPFHLFKEKDILAGVMFGGVVFAVWMMVTVSTTGMFQKAFGLNDVMLGLALVTNFAGAILGSTVLKSILARNFEASCSMYRAQHKLPPTQPLSRDALPADFPLEHARLWHHIWLIPILVITVSGYGFTLTYKSVISRPGWMLLPMTLQFIIAAAAYAVCTIQETLIADLWYQSEQASTNASNLAKYSLAALGAGVVQLQLNGMGAWSTFVSLGLVIMACLVLPVMQWYWGVEWRAEREAKNAILERFRARPFV